MRIPLKEHPFYERLRTVSLKEAGGFVSDVPIELADKETRKKMFREFSRIALVGYKERKQHGYNSDLGGEITRALEQAYLAGRKASNKGAE